MTSIINQAFCKWIILGTIIWGWLVLGAMPVQAGELYDRWHQFPNWHHKPSVQAAHHDLTYPDWMAGRWLATSTLVEMVAPLAPDITTPGFEGNRRYLHQPMTFQVRFINPPQSAPKQIVSPFPNLTIVPKPVVENFSVVADRAFNGLNLARAYLGEQAVLGVEVDPQRSNRQVTQFKGGLQLISNVTAQASETLPSGEFIATELSQQFFRGQQPSYLNEVEVTTLYRRSEENDPTIQADQMTAIYASPKDPNYFKARQQPLALYRYQLTLQPLNDKDPL